MPRLWRDDWGQDIAEYALLLAFILTLVIGTVKIVGQATVRNLDRAEDLIH